MIVSQEPCNGCTIYLFRIRIAEIFGNIPRTPKRKILKMYVISVRGYWYFFASLVSGIFSSRTLWKTPLKVQIPVPSATQYPRDSITLDDEALIRRTGRKIVSLEKMLGSRWKSNEREREREGGRERERERERQRDRQRDRQRERREEGNNNCYRIWLSFQGTLSSMRRLAASVERERKRRRGNAVVPYCCITFIVHRARDSRMQSAIFWTKG